jgi:hypothetical protein
MEFKLSKKATFILGLLCAFTVLFGYLAYIESQKDTHQTPTTPTENPDNSNTAIITDYTVTIPEIYKLGFGVAEINMKFIAPSPSLQEQQFVSEANFTTTILPTTFSTKPNNTSNLTLPAIFNGTTIEIKVDVYQYTMITDNPRILVASQQWNETKYNFT